MLQWTLRELAAAPQQLIASIAAVAGAIALVLFFEGTFAGESEQAVALIDRTDADVWVMQNGVENMHMTTSFVADWKIDAVAALECVEKVTPILYLNTVIEAGPRNWFSFVVGIEDGDPRAGPWRPAGGDSLPGPGTAIVPDVFASDAGIGLGDTVRIAGQDFAVAGFSAETFSMANSVTFVTMSDLAETISSIGAVSYMLVDGCPDLDAAALADRITAEVDDINALTREQFSSYEYDVAVQMGLEVVWIMTLIGGALAVLLTGFVVSSHIADREHELAVMKALGVRNGAIYVSSMLQALAIGALAYGVAIAAMLVAVPLTEALVPKVSLALTGAAIARAAGMTLIAALVASVIPVRRVLSVDPMTAFQR